MADTPEKRDDKVVDVKPSEAVADLVSSLTAKKEDDKKTQAPQKRRGRPARSQTIAQTRRGRPAAAAKTSPEQEARKRVERAKRTQAKLDASQKPTKKPLIPISIGNLVLFVLIVSILLLSHISLKLTQDDKVSVVVSQTEEVIEEEGLDPAEKEAEEIAVVEEVKSGEEGNDAGLLRSKDLPPTEESGRTSAMTNEAEEEVTVVEKEGEVEVNAQKEDLEVATETIERSTHDAVRSTSDLLLVSIDEQEEERLKREEEERIKAAQVAEIVAEHCPPEEKADKIAKSKTKQRSSKYKRDRYTDEGPLDLDGEGYRKKYLDTNVVMVPAKEVKNFDQKTYKTNKVFETATRSEIQEVPVKERKAYLQYETAAEAKERKSKKKKTYRHHSRNMSSRRNY